MTPLPPATAIALPKLPASSVFIDSDGDAHGAFIPSGNMFTADEMNAHATAAVEADRARAVAAPAGWKIERQPTGELIINGPYVGVVVRENPSELRLIPEEALFMLATDLLAATQATAVAVPDEVAKLAGDFIEHEHPMFGDGYFCTPDVFERIAALALAPSPASPVEMGDTEESRTAFRDFESRWGQIAHATNWQVWREAVAWCRASLAAIPVAAKVQP